MSRQPRFEEIEDDGDDPGELDLPDFGGSSTVLAPRDFPQPSTGGMPQSADSAFKPKTVPLQDQEQFKHWSCIYPVYFDASRSLREGRKVPQKLAIKNPMAKELADAATSLNIQVYFEANKTHPKDWSNPGRIRIPFQHESGRRGTPYKTKQSLYAAMSVYLQAHPADKDSPMKLQLPGLRVDAVPPPPAVPKGWKINEILPVYSNALSGGGVSDNLMRDLMREEGMQGPVPVKKAKKIR